MTTPLLAAAPEAKPRCELTGAGDWRCSADAAPGLRYCQTHAVMQRWQGWHEEHCPRLPAQDGSRVLCTGDLVWPLVGTVWPAAAPDPHSPLTCRQMFLRGELARVKPDTAAAPGVETCTYSVPNGFGTSLCGAVAIHGTGRCQRHDELAQARQEIADLRRVINGLEARIVELTQAKES